MKATSLLHAAVWFLLAITLGQSITCFRCHDEERGSSCKRQMDAIDCSSDSEYGEYYDSCFSLNAFRGKKRIQIKDCAMGFACGELEEILCKEQEEGNNVHNFTGQSCKLECCKDDFCNEDNVGASNTVRSLMAIETVLLSSVAVVFYVLTVVTLW